MSTPYSYTWNNTYETTSYLELCQPKGSLATVRTLPGIQTVQLGHSLIFNCISKSGIELYNLVDTIEPL